MARRIKNEADARACLAAVKASRGDLAGWARIHGVDARSLNAWHMNLARGRAGVAPQRRSPLVELVVAQPSRAARYSLEIEGARLEFGDDCSGDTLRRVVMVLRSC